MSAAIRDALETDGSAILSVDLRPKPDAKPGERAPGPTARQAVTLKHLRRTLKLQGIQAALLKALTDKSVMNDPDRLSSAIKNLPLKITATRPIAEAISTAGGIGLDEVDESLMVKRSPGLFIAGEMLDWKLQPEAICSPAVFLRAIARPKASRTIWILISEISPIETKSLLC